MNYTDAWYGNWRHVFKLDPDKEITDEALEAVCMSGTDAIIIGGSSGVTFENTVDLMARVRRYALDCVLEVSTMDGAVPGFDGYFVPIVLNTSRAEWINGKQTEGLKEYGTFVPWELTAAQGYIILNGEATAARISGADAALDAEDVVAHVRMASRLMRLPVIYIEYSGMFGDMNVLEAARGALDGDSRLFYGGGIDNAEKAAQAARHADTVVVGNVVYTDLAAALATVAAVREVQSAKA
ncbi:heptaprenylglyceryl phosphate synthase [Paenibacillus sp. NPDC058071]|uniref:heptaprenylglyceryl phosphate synthase n=1 Tax=Paenibacillus sp. NPDC058071 TaxID=3346326 RepID=UPI0036D91450